MAASTDRELAVEIRPGVFRPDWSIVTASEARHALHGRMSARSNLFEKWSHALDESEDLVWRAILRLYADRGRPPTSRELVTETGMYPDRIFGLLRNLDRRDLICMEGNTQRILRAYPFTETTTGHLVELNGHSFNALCAIDALGVGSMYRTDVRIGSTCRFCGETVSIATAGDGRELGVVSPVDVVVWYDFAFEGNAATSCCPVIAFFCSDGHLRRWLDVQKPEREGVCLTVEEGLQVGRAIFGPILATPVSTHNLAPRSR
ncbi:MAG: organomercurial lyase [Pseudomonadota bacterium]